MMKTAKIPREVITAPRQFGQTGEHDQISKLCAEAGIDLSKPFRQNWEADPAFVLYEQEVPDAPVVQQPPAVPVPEDQRPPAVPIPVDTSIPNEPAKPAEVGPPDPPKGEHPNEVG